ncbi:MAG: DNA ligase (NAD(+)) LigA, partial [Hyphomicrobium sp.]
MAKINKSKAQAKPSPKKKSLVSEGEAAAEIKRLSAEIRRHDALYYQNDAPEISDADYDALRQQLETLERKFPEFAHSESPTQNVGAAPVSAFGKVRHDVPMLSLSNAFADDDVADFTARIRRFLNLTDTTALDVVAEPKIDGLSISIRYENGQLTQAATRGDGAEGENVTANIKTIKAIPHALKGQDVPVVIDVRGEIYLSHADFAALNTAQEKSGGKI